MDYIKIKKCSSPIRGQTAEIRRTTILQPVEGKPHSQKDRQKEKAEDFVPGEVTKVMGKECHVEMPVKGWPGAWGAMKMDKYRKGNSYKRTTMEIFG